MVADRSYESQARVPPLLWAGQPRKSSQGDYADAVWVAGVCVGGQVQKIKEERLTPTDVAEAWGELGWAGWGTGSLVSILSTVSP